MKRETLFRTGLVLPFLKTLKNIEVFPIQQLAFHDDPDFFMSGGGKMIAMELKAADGELRPLQRHKLLRIRDTGNIAFVARPQTWEIARQLLSLINTQGDPFGKIKILPCFELQFRSSYSKNWINTNPRKRGESDPQGD